MYRIYFLIIYVTKQMTDATDSVDRPALQNDEIEITPEMIEAGVDVLAMWYAEPYPVEVFQRLSREIFDAMQRVARPVP